MLTGLGPLSVDMYLPSLPYIARLLDAPTAQVQLTISAYLVGFACGAVFYGPLSDRHGRRPVLLAALGIYLLAPAGLRAVVLDRDADRARASCRRSAARGAHACWRAPSCATCTRARASAASLSLHGGDHGAGAAGRAADRRRAADRVRLALEFRGAVLLRRCGARPWCGSCCRKRLRQRAPEPVSLGSMLRSYRRFLARSRLRRPSRHRDVLPVRAVRLDFQRRLRAAGHLRPVAVRLRRRLRGRLGRATWSAPRSRRASSMRWGSGRTMGFGAAAMALGGLVMVAALALGMRSARRAGRCRWRSISSAWAWRCRRRSAGALLPFPDAPARRHRCSASCSRPSAAVCRRDPRPFARADAPGRSPSAMALVGCASAAAVGVDARRCATRAARSAPAEQPVDQPVVDAAGACGGRPRPARPDRRRRRRRRPRADRIGGRPASQTAAADARRAAPPPARPGARRS